MRQGNSEGNKSLVTVTDLFNSKSIFWGVHSLMVEPHDVTVVGVGSNPTGHPKVYFMGETWRVVSIPDCKSGAKVHCRFEPYLTHQICVHSV